MRIISQSTSFDGRANLRKYTCFFVGHRTIPTKKIKGIVINLNIEIDKLIKRGVTNFISNGAVGFGHIAAFSIIAKKKNGANIRLILALPCQTQDERWTDKQKPHI